MRSYEIAIRNSDIEYERQRIYATVKKVRYLVSKGWIDIPKKVITALKCEGGLLGSIDSSMIKHILSYIQPFCCSFDSDEILRCEIPYSYIIIEIVINLGSSSVESIEYSKDEEGIIRTEPYVYAWELEKGISVCDYFEDEEDNYRGNLILGKGVFSGKPRLGICAKKEILCTSPDVVKSVIEIHRKNLLEIYTTQVMGMFDIFEKSKILSLIESKVNKLKSQEEVRKELFEIHVEHLRHSFDTLWVKEIILSVLLTLDIDTLGEYLKLCKDVVKVKVSKTKSTQETSEF